MRPLCLAVGAALAAASTFASAQTLPGTDTTLRIGGYVKLDAIFNSRSCGANCGGDQLLTPQLIPVGPGAGDNERGQLTVHARQSRVNVRTNTPTTKGPFTTFIEGDFFGAAGNETVSNSHGFRLRHAYGTLGDFGAGQTWTNFMNVAWDPETLNFGGTVGEIFVRQPQVRWTRRTGTGAWSISLENPEAIFAVPGTDKTFRADDDRYPDIVGRVDFSVGNTKLFVAALARNIRIDSAAAPAAVDDEWGAGLTIGGLVPTAGRDDFRFLAYGGNSIGRYNTPGFYVDGVIDAAGQIELPAIIGGFVAYRHFWTPDLRSSLVFGASRANNPSGTFAGSTSGPLGGINKSDAAAHVNLIYSPWKNIDVGVEYTYAEREIEGGLSGTLNRVQFSAQYNF